MELVMSISIPVTLSPEAAAEYLKIGAAQSAQLILKHGIPPVDSSTEIQFGGDAVLTFYRAE